MEKIGIALIGAGTIAQNAHLPNLTKIRNAKVVALCDSNRSKAKILAEKFGIPHVCKSVDELMKIDGIQAVDICTSTESHVDVGVACLESGKDVLIERPIAPTVEGARILAETAERFERKIMVSMPHRFRRDTVTLKSALERRELGNVYYVKSGWLLQRTNDKKLLSQLDKAGYGVLLDLGISLLDMVLWMFNYPEIYSVRATTYKHFTHRVEDFILSTLHFADGATATMEASWSLQRPDELYYCNIYGEQGSAFINPLKVVKRAEQGFSEYGDTKQESRLQRHQKAYAVQLQHFINSVEGLVPVISTAREAVDRMKVVEALYRSAEERMEVRL